MEGCTKNNLTNKQTNMKTKSIMGFLGTSFLAVILAIAFVGGSVFAIPVALGIGLVANATAPYVQSGVIGANSYAATVLQDARSFIKSNDQKKFNLRPEFTKVMEAFLANRDFTIPNLSALRKATTQTTTAMYMKKGSWTIGTGKSCAPTGETAGSGSVNLSWLTRTFSVTSNQKQFQGNELTKQMVFANDLYNAEVNFWAQIDVLLLAYLETNKSGVNNGGSGYFDTTNDIYAMNQSNKNFFYNLLTADMQKNKYSPTYIDIHDTMWTAEQRKWVNQGGGNSTNTAFQFDGFSFKPTNLLSPGTIGSNTYESVHYVVPEGGVAIIDWNDPTNLAGDGNGISEKMTMQSLLRPEFTFDVYKTKACQDTTSSGGGTQDYVDNWEFAFNFALATQPIENAGETAIFKYGVMNDDSFVS